MDLLKLMRERLDITGPAEAWPDRAAEDIVIRLPYAPPGVKSELRGMAERLATLSPVWRDKQSVDWRDVEPAAR
jgi:hypothetical protein